MGLNRRRVAALVGCALAGVAPIGVLAETLGSLRVSEAWSRPTPPGTRLGALYLSIQNLGGVADRLIGAASPLADQVEFHQSTLSGGVLSMRVVPFIDCPAGVTRKIAPGDLHIMLLGLKEPLALGSSFPVTLQFSHAGKLTVNVFVQAHE